MKKEARTDALNQHWLVNANVIFLDTNGDTLTKNVNVFYKNLDVLTTPKMVQNNYSSYKFYIPPTSLDLMTITFTYPNLAFKPINYNFFTSCCNCPRNVIIDTINRKIDLGVVAMKKI